MCQLSWFLDPGGWSKTATVGLYFIFPGICTLSLGELSDRVYNYPEGLGEVLYREQFDFNAEPPWEPS
ncbi:hypothetical protein STEG23_000312 [Scotinomys teguina]